MSLQWWGSLASWAGVYRKEAMRADPTPTSSFGSWDEFGRWESRNVRYAINWALYVNDAYDNIRLTAERYKTDHGLYRYTRGIYNPAFRLVEFNAANIYGGAADVEAGDGYSVDTSIPIQTQNEAVRPALSRLWADSDIAELKAQYPRVGSICGDVGLKVMDDPEEGRVAVRAVWPGSIRFYQEDQWGRCVSYVIEELRPDPEVSSVQDWVRSQVDPVNYVTYTEWAVLQGGSVRYQTFLNGKPHAWNGSASTWTMPYGRVPFVLHRHVRPSPSMAWGMGEYHATAPKIREVDDLASKLHDQVRKAVEGMWFFSGVSRPRPSDARNATSAATLDNPMPGRQEVPSMYASMGATATPLVIPVNVAETSLAIAKAMENLEQDHPALAWRNAASKDASGAARREARKAVEIHVKELRAGYDADFAKIMKIAISIAGQRGYDGYDGFNLGSIKDKSLDFRIDDRPVFLRDQLDKAEYQTMLWQGGTAAVAAGYPIVEYLRDNGWTDEQISKMLTERDRESAWKTEQASKMADATAPPAPAANSAP